MKNGLARVTRAVAPPMFILAGENVRTNLILSLALSALLFSATAFAQSSGVTGAIRGTVTIAPSGTMARNAVVTIAELKKSVLTDQKGAFEFRNIPTGKYQIFAHLD